MENLAQAAEKVESIMRLLTTKGGLRLKYRVTTGADAVDPYGFERRDIYVECNGTDTDLLLDNDGELLRSIEHLAEKMLRLEPDDYDCVSLDANGFKASRARALRESAEAAMAKVHDSGEPYRFPPMSSRERRILHLFLRDSGLQTASTGEPPRRCVVLYPAGFHIPPERSYNGPERRKRPRSHTSPGRY
jgi:spoIIIJ-associated protein